MSGESRFLTSRGEWDHDALASKWQELAALESTYDWSLSQERQFIETLVNQRFYYFFIVYTVIVAGSLAADTTAKAVTILLIGLMLLLPMLVAIYRANDKLHHILKLLHRLEAHPVQFIGRLADGRDPISSEQVQPKPLIVFLFRPLDAVGSIVPTLAWTTLVILLCLFMAGQLGNTLQTQTNVAAPAAVPRPAITADYLFVFHSLIVGFVAVAFLEGWRTMIRNRQRTTVSRLQVLWSVFLFVLLIETWWGAFDRRDLITQNFIQFVISLVGPVMFYLITLFLFEGERAGIDYPRGNSTATGGGGDQAIDYFWRNRTMFYLFVVLLISWFFVSGLLFSSDSGWRLVVASVIRVAGIAVLLTAVPVPNEERLPDVLKWWPRAAARWWFPSDQRWWHEAVFGVSVLLFVVFVICVAWSH